MGCCHLGSGRIPVFNRPLIVVNYFHYGERVYLCVITVSQWCEASVKYFYQYDPMYLLLMNLLCSQVVVCDLALGFSSGIVGIIIVRLLDLDAVIT